MTSSCLTPSRRRWKAVRVADVPAEKRLQAAVVACRHETDPAEKLAILAVAVNPGDLTAYIAA